MAADLVRLDRYMLELRTWIESFRSFERLKTRNEPMIGSTLSCLPKSGSIFCSNWSNATGARLAKLQHDLREFIVLLNSHGVEYLVVGGHAVAYHGHPRFTGDIDFLIRAAQSNAQRVLNVLHAFGFGDLGITEGDLVGPGRIIQLGHPPNRIDVLTSISGVDFESAWQSRVETLIGDQPVNLLGWEDLLRNKRASGRQKDLADLEKLLAVAKRKRPG